LLEKDLRNWSLIDRFARCLDRRLGTPRGSWGDPRRQLGQAQYLTLFLLGLFNPVVRTVRGICAASQLQKVRRQWNSPPVSLGSFSEAQHLCDPGLLEQIFQDLSRQIPAPTLQDPRQQWAQWLAQDSSVFAALPRMSWAVYGGGRRSKEGGATQAVRLHLSFNVISDHPAAVRVTPGKTCERKAWREQWEKGAAYVGDRYYGEDYGLLEELDQAGCSYVVRLRQQAIIRVLEELPLTDEDRQAGVVRQARVRLGDRPAHGELRVVWVATPAAGTLVLATNLEPTGNPAALVAQIYRRRWQIEGFFRWVKCRLGCRHWLAESQRGVTLQLYLALIGALLLHLHLGRRPNQRMLELLQLHQLGWVDQAELMARLAAEQAREQKRKSARR
jgi:hypothetical protein